MAKPKCRCLDPRAPRRAFGQLRVLASGKHHARYRIPGTRRYANAPTTFDTHAKAEAWLATIQADMERGAWLAPTAKLTFGEYAGPWLAGRRIKGNPIKPRTRAEYQRLLDDVILPAFGHMQLKTITPAAVREWHARLPASTPTSNARAYSLLRTICRSAMNDDLISANPCRIVGAGEAPRASKTEPATPEELAAIVAALPQRYRLMVLLAAWCALRFGELTELRGRDIDTKAGIVRVRRAVVWVRDLEDVQYCDCSGTKDHVVGPPKSQAGIRDVAVPPHLLPMVREHILAVGAGRDGLLFPAAKHPNAHMRPATLYKVYYAARDAAGRPDLRFHDLRHTGATMAASTGATIAELMARLGHSTPSAAMRYQHATNKRDAAIANELSKLAEANDDAAARRTP